MGLIICWCTMLRRDDLVLLAPSPSALRIMLHCCEDFAISHGLRFNASKTQLIRFSCSPSATCSARFQLGGHQLSFLDTVTHLGHLLHYNLNDSLDIQHKLREMVKKANCVFASFPRVGPAILTRLFQSYCLSLHGSALWALSRSGLQAIEIGFNKCLRRIWNLPSHSHTRIVHLIARLHSLYNVVFHRSLALLRAALTSPSQLVRIVFCESSSVC